MNKQRRKKLYSRAVAVRFVTWVRTGLKPRASRLLVKLDVAAQEVFPQWADATPEEKEHMMWKIRHFAVRDARISGMAIGLVTEQAFTDKVDKNPPESLTEALQYIPRGPNNKSVGFYVALNNKGRDGYIPVATRLVSARAGKGKVEAFEAAQVHPDFVGALGNGSKKLLQQKLNEALQQLTAAQDENRQLKLLGAAA